MKFRRTWLVMVASLALFGASPTWAAPISWSTTSASVSVSNKADIFAVTGTSGTISSLPTTTQAAILSLSAGSGNCGTSCDTGPITGTIGFDMTLGTDTEHVVVPYSWTGSMFGDGLQVGPISAVNFLQAGGAVFKAQFFAGPPQTFTSVILQGGQLLTSSALPDPPLLFVGPTHPFASAPLEATVTQATASEPASLTLLLAGIAGLKVLRRRRRG